MLMPSNLSILSTMNTSDQSLFPMDSAFKRRWQWEYVPIDYEKDPNKNKSANFLIQIDSKTTINWIDFIERINTKIQNNSNLGMDKCIGNYFVVPNAKNIIDLENFIHKVIFYLWNDVFKDEPRDSIFQSSVSYQSFFPINPHGVKEVKKILEVLNLISSNENTTEIRTENDTID
jgi:5-methylcytosine-specific restriction endonuclease McrBC GTP-binding regulatory subunit McrB